MQVAALLVLISCRRVESKNDNAGPLARREWREANLAGWDSSHTAPCGAAVPARPPTRYWEIKGRVRLAQWIIGARKLGTGVLVPASRDATNCDINLFFTITYRGTKAR